MATDEAKRQAVLAEIERQGGLIDRFDDAKAPVVSLEMFFEGNDDLGSIGCNLWVHPGVKTFYRTLLALRERDDVQDVLIAINDIEPETEGFWPFCNTVYILSNAQPHQIRKAIKRLKPDEVGLVWPGIPIPERLPTPEPGYDVMLAWWD